MRRLLLLAAVAVVLPAPAQAAFPGDNGKIVFSTWTNSGSIPYIVTIDPDGSNYTVIRDADNYPTRQEWSPDGKRIAEGAYGGITTFKADGSDYRIYAVGGWYGEGADWSPDGTKFVHFVYCCAIRIVNVDDGATTQIHTMATEPVRVQPAWSPDGERIAFAEASGSDLEIYTIKPDGTNLVQLTNNATNDSNPSWAPDGTKIAFESYADYGSPPVEIHTINADGTNEVKLRDGSDPEWSPDGKKMVFAYPTEGCIYTMNTDGSGVTPVTFVDPEYGTGCQESSPDWQPLTPPGYARPKGASPSTFRLVPSYKPCTSPNAEHGAPLVEGSCSPAEPTSDFLTVGTPDRNGKASNSTGYLRMTVLTESPIDLTNGDQSDVRFDALLTDVREKQTLADYTGELRAVFTLQLTDRFNGPGGVHPGTVQTTLFGFNFSCTPTAEPPDVGSTCSISTTADAIMPGITPEAKRAIWQLGRIAIQDGGSDGDADTAGNTVFARQGLLAP